MRLELALGATLAASGFSASANAAPPPVANERPGAPLEPAFAPRLSFGLSAGALLPSCDGQPEACAARLPVSPSFTGLVLLEPSRAWAFGLMQGVTRVSWQTLIPSPSGNPAPTRTLDAELTTVFVAVVARVTLLPARGVAPIIQAALGDAFQSETGGFVSCDFKFNPTGQLALGARMRLAPSWSVFALASATGGLRGGACAVVDGPPATPFAAWGYGLQVGAAFDLALGPS
jgi:hypothetical protein